MITLTGNRRTHAIRTLQRGQSPFLHHMAIVATQGRNRDTLQLQFRFNLEPLHRMFQDVNNAFKSLSESTRRARTTHVQDGPTIRQRWHERDGQLSHSTFQIKSEHGEWHDVPGVNSVQFNTEGES